MVAQSDLDDSGWFYVSNLIKGFPGGHPSKGQEVGDKATTSLSYFYDFELCAQSGSSSTENEKKERKPASGSSTGFIACMLAHCLV